METDLIALASRLGLPPVRLRAALASFADLAESAPRARVCRGTSCELHGAPRLAERVGSVARPAYCLGHCDRSPVALDAVGRVHARCATGPADGSPFDREPAPAPTAVRSLAREPIVTRRIGRGDFSRLADARADGAWRVLEAAVGGRPEAVLEAIERPASAGAAERPSRPARSGALRQSAPGGPRYVVANGDEGDPGSFVDRVLLESDPHGVLEGLALCAFAVGASRGHRLRPLGVPARDRARWSEAIADAERARAGSARDVRGSGFSLRRARRPRARQLRVRRGDGAAERDRGTARRGAAAPAVSDRARARRLPDGRQQRRDARERAVDRRARRGGVRARSARRASRGTKALCLNASFAAARDRRGRVRHVACATVLEEVGGGPGDAAPSTRSSSAARWAASSFRTSGTSRSATARWRSAGSSSATAASSAVPARHRSRGPACTSLDLHGATSRAGSAFRAALGSARALALARADWRANAEPLDRAARRDGADAASAPSGRRMPGPMRGLLALARRARSARERARSTAARSMRATARRSSRPRGGSASRSRRSATRDGLRAGGRLPPLPGRDRGSGAPACGLPHARSPPGMRIAHAIVRARRAAPRRSWRSPFTSRAAARSSRTRTEASSSGG